MPKARWCIKLLLPLYKKKKEKNAQDTFLDTLKSIKTSIGFGATLHNSFNKEDYFLGLNSHDFYNIFCYHLHFSI
jgi:hypothetical protein